MGKFMPGFVTHDAEMAEACLQSELKGENRLRLKTEFAPKNLGSTFTLLWLGTGAILVLPERFHVLGNLSVNGWRIVDLVGAKKANEGVRLEC
jgi:hypothetical protein